MTSHIALQGAFTALVTPFAADGSIDFDALQAHIQGQLDGGIDGLVPCGTTGETPTLSDDEQAQVIETTVRLAKGRVPIVAGASSNCTAKTIKLAKRAVEVGADAVMIAAPYYNKPTQEGLFAHITTVAKEIQGTPVVVYNIPGRSIVDISLDTMSRIAEAAPNVFAIKDATGNVLRCQATIQRLGDRLTIMCGDDALTVPMMAVGAKGVISVTSNVLPGPMASVCRHMREGRHTQGLREHLALLAVHDAMFVETSPAPAKAALAHLGRMRGGLRLPLVEPSEKSRALVVDAVERFMRGNA